MSELTLFGPEEAYVYQVPAQQTTNGPRAELWDVLNPLATVAVTLTRALDASDTCLVRLRDPESNELFAEAPITSPLHTCVERAIDSSRYFCVRVVDGGSGKHAFIGLGFLTREPAGDFFGALIDHQQYVERRERAKEGGGTSGGAGAQPLQPGLTLKLNSNAGLSHGGGFVSGGSSKQGSLAKTFSLMFAENGGVEAALSSASNDSSPHAVAGRRDTTDASVGTDLLDRGEVEQFEGGWGAFESA
jgi:hypothetical protein